MAGRILGNPPRNLRLPPLSPLLQESDGRRLPLARCYAGKVALLVEYLQEEDQKGSQALQY